MRIVRALLAKLTLGNTLKRFQQGLAVAILFAGSLVSSAQTNGPGSFNFATADFQFSEGDPNAIVVVTRDGPLGKMQVDLVVTNGTATNQVHYIATTVTNTLVFDDFITSASFLVPIINDTSGTNGPNRTVTLSLANPRPAPGEDPALLPLLGRTSRSKITILDDDATNSFNLAQTYYTVNEGGTIDIKVRLSAPPGGDAQEVAVDYRVSANTNLVVRPGSDYASASDFVEQTGTLTFDADDVEQTISVLVNNDSLVEFDEDFFVELTAARGKIVVQTETGGTTTGTTTGTSGTTTGPLSGGLTAGTLGGLNAGSTAGTDGGDLGEFKAASATTGGADGGTDGGAPTTTEIPFKLGNVTVATVTILFNGATNAPQAAGAVDQNYNADDIQETNPPYNQNPGANNTVYAVTSYQGKTIIGGEFTAVNTKLRNRIAVLDAQGQIDETFNPIGGANDFVTAIAVYRNQGPDQGKILIGGGFTAVNGEQRNSVARLNANGTIDSSFNPGMGANGPVYAVSIQSDGRILIGGDFTTYEGIAANRIARLNDDGSLDTTFEGGLGANGAVYTIYSEVPPPNITTVTQNVISTNVQTVRTINAGGSAGSYVLTFNFGSFSNQIQVLYENQTIYDSQVRNNEVITTDPDGNTTTNFVPVIVAGDFGPGNSRELTFVVNPGATNEGGPFTYSVQIQPEGVAGTLIGGDFTSFNGIEVGRLARLNERGALDTSFIVGLGADGPVNTIEKQRDGRILVGGAFLSYNSIPNNRLVRLNRDGTLDRTFSIGSGFDDTVNDITVGPGDEIYVAGSFYSVNQSRRIFLTRLSPNGPVDTSFLDTAYNQLAGFPNPSGFAPNGLLNSVALDARGVLVGGSFSQVGGGDTRTATKPRANFARLVGGKTPGPGTIEFTEPTFAADENGRELVVVVRRTLMDDGDEGVGTIIAKAFTVDGTATGDVDYFSGVAEIEFPVQRRQTEVLLDEQYFYDPIYDDTLIEGDENYFLPITEPLGYVLLGGVYAPTVPSIGAVSVARANIIDNDVIPTEIFLSANEFDVNENDGTVTFNVARSGNLSGSATVRFATSQSTNGVAATPGVDYTAGSGSITFLGGQTNKTITLTIRDDAQVEQDETINLRLLNPSLGVVFPTNQPSSALVTIIDNDYEPGRASFVASAYSVTEGGVANVTVQRRGGNVGILRLDYRTESLTANTPSDYSENSGTLIWNNLDTTPKVIRIPLAQDGLVEGNETFQVILSNPNPSGGLGGRTNTVVTIADDDFRGNLAYNAPLFLANENGTNAIITVVRRGGSSESVTVGYATTSLDAVPGTDYRDVSGTLTFEVGETSKSFIIPIIDDSATDGERAVSLTLTNALPTGAGFGAITNAVLVIIDNETLNVPAGSTDSDFFTGFGANDIVNTIEIDELGAIYIGGDFTLVNRQARPHLARIFPDGTLDPSFGLNFELNNDVRDIAVQSDGKIVVGGVFTTIDGLPSRHIARVGPGGVRDNTFNPGSGTDTPVLAVEETFVRGVRKLLVAGGFSVYNGANRRGIARLNEDGSTDVSFDPRSGVNGTIYDIALQRDGKIIIGGEFSSVDGVARQNIARLNQDGTIDESFDPGLGVDGSVRSVLITFDDKIMVGGLFQKASDVERPYVARLQPDGRLDSTFNTGSGPNGAVYAIAQQLDGKFIIGGDFTSINGTPQIRIARLNEDGSVDTSINFGSGANNFVSAIALQPDRNILIGGAFTRVDNAERNYFAGIYGGSLTGSGEFQFSSPDFIAVETMTNAVITVRRMGGLANTVTVNYSTSSRTAEATVDYFDVSGTLTFAPGENAKTFIIPLANDDFAEQNEFVNLQLGLPTGGAVLGRQPIATLTIRSEDTVIGFEEINFSTSEAAAGGRATIRVRRQGDFSLPLQVNYTTANGTATAGSDYAAASGTLEFLPSEQFKAFTIQVIDDQEVEDNETVRLTLSSPSQGGILDTARTVADLTIFDNDFSPGVINFPATASVAESGGAISIAVTRGSGRTGTVSVDYSITGGTAAQGTDYIASNGTLSFQEGETNKVFTIQIRDDAAVEGNETIILTLGNITGGARLGNRSNLQVVIVDDDFGPGSFDTSFNIGSGADGPVYAIDIQQDGKIALGGDFGTFAGTSRGSVARVLPTGALDTSFNPGSGANGPVFTLTLHTNTGKVVVGGDFTTFAGVSRRFVGRFLTNGAPDAEFNMFAGENAFIRDLAVQPDGKVIVGGDFTTPAARVIRLNANGSLDVSFEPTGGANGAVNAIALQTDGKVLVGGAFTRISGLQIRGIARLMPNGLIDGSFQIGSGVNGVVEDIFVQADGKILLVGQFTSVNGSNGSKVARLNANGTVDTGFNPPAVDGNVLTVEYALDHVYIGGEFSNVGTASRSNIARLEMDGTLDSLFDPGVGPNGPVYDIEVQDDGQIIIAGEFTTVNGFNSRGIARLNGNAPVVEPVEIRITNMTVSQGGQVSFSFNSDTGRTYLIEASADLSSWQQIQTVNGTGAAVNITDSTASGPYRFYRVRLNQ